MPDDPQERAKVELESDSVRHLHPGLGRALFGAAVAAFLGSFALDLVVRLASSQGWAALRELLAAVSSFIFGLSPFLAVLSVLVTSLSIPGSARATLEASERGLRIRTWWRSRWIPRERLVSGLVMPSMGRRALELSLPLGRKIVVAVEREAQAEELLAALGMDAARRRVAVMLGTSNRQLAAGCSAVPLVSVALLILFAYVDVLRSISPHILTAAFTVVMLLIIRSARPLEVTVGTDGLVLQGAWRRRFIAYSAVDRVTMNRSTHIVVRMKSGREIKITKSDELTRRGLYDRIQQAMRVHREGDAEARAELELLEPRGRPLAAWREALRSVTGTEKGYRRAGIPEETLLAVVEDPDAAPGRRIGAAMALRASGHGEAATRIRVAAEACASEPIKEALERAAEDELDQETLERALEEAARAERRA